VDNGTTTSYGYDDAGQLLTAGATSYRYDANGNPTNTGDVIGPNNELLSDGTWNYRCDANGNLVGRLGVGGGADAGLTWSYRYDAANQLVGATETNAQSQALVQAAFTFDALGRRIESSIAPPGGAVPVMPCATTCHTTLAPANPWPPRTPLCYRCAMRPRKSLRGQMGTP